MRITALFCGLIAGLFALYAPVLLGNDLLTPFLEIFGAASSRQLLGVIAWHAPAAAAVLGGIVALLAPGVGAALLLGAAVGWGAIGLLDTSFMRMELLVPAGIALFGAVLAFLTGEIEMRRRRAARRTRREEFIDTAERVDVETLAREAAFRMDPRTVTREEAPPRPAREIPLKLDDVVPVAPEPAPRPSAAIWPDSPGRRSMFDRPEAELTPRRSLFDRPVARVDRPVELREDEGTPRRTMWMWIAAANGVVVIALVVAVGYVMLQRGPASAASATTPAVSTPAAPAAPKAPAVADPGESASDRLIPNLWPALADPNAPAPVAEAAVEGAFADPYSYCAAVRTVDYVDSRYTGPRFTPEIAQALRVPLQSAPDRVSWRCVDGAVLACTSFDWPACAMTPTAQEMIDYCQRNPGTTRLLAPNGTWSCEGDRPRIPEGASWPVDARGFYPNVWVRVNPPQPSAG